MLIFVCAINEFCENILVRKLCIFPFHAFSPSETRKWVHRVSFLSRKWIGRCISSSDWLLESLRILCVTSLELWFSCEWINWCCLLYNLVFYDVLDINYWYFHINNAFYICDFVALLCKYLTKGHSGFYLDHNHFSTNAPQF